jgi:16S rRNA (uracil1498-N3)-methyltransferase
MSAPLFLVDALPAGSSYTMDGPEGRHAATVQRLRVGETLLLGDGGGAIALARVTAVGRDRLDVTIEQRWYEDPPDPRLVAVQGIAKGDRGELAVQVMTEVGVDEVVPWAAARSVVRWQGDRGDRSHRRWVDIAREAAKQARRARLPAVAPPAATATVASRLGAAALALVLDEEAATPLTTVDLPSSGDIVVVVGPEGGITPEELSAFVAAGAVAVRLGTTVLRTSTAGAAALSVLSARLGRW